MHNIENLICISFLKNGLIALVTLKKSKLETNVSRKRGHDCVNFDKSNE